LSLKAASVYQFGRPHTLAATSFQTLGIFTLVAAGERLETSSLLALALAWAGSLAANLYVVGLNQLFDLEIDRINKPYLPLASGDLTLPQAKGIVLAAGSASLLIGLLGGIYLLGTLAAVMLIGTIYSTPPLRLKLHAGWAALSISLARGLIANGGLFLFFSNRISSHHPVPAGAVLLGLTFFFLFGIVIALYKDIPDWQGDLKVQVRTFAVTLGRERVFRLGRWLLTATYLLAVVGSLLFWQAPGGLSLALIHLIALAFFWWVGAQTAPANLLSVRRLYRLLWFLFYAEFAVMGIFRLVSAL
jgi:homogentisate phytyltransferase/homogentisate geranylgeranyltransferase